MTTTNLADFGICELEMARDLLSAMIEQELPKDFDDDGVVLMSNPSSGCVFLTNSECQVAMINGDKLESFYTSLYGGSEGFYDDLKEEYDDMSEDEKEWFDNLK